LNKIKLDVEKLSGIGNGELPALLSEKEAAALTGLSVSFLRKSRSEGYRGGRTRAPDFVAVGRRRLYRVTDIEKWINSLKAREANY
jgi:predicted DNA-binding transcriptional regulator AlpA